MICHNTNIFQIINSIYLIKNAAIQIKALSIMSCESNHRIMWDQL